MTAKALENGDLACQLGPETALGALRGHLAYRAMGRRALLNYRRFSTNGMKTCLAIGGNDQCSDFDLWRKGCGIMSALR